MMFANLKAYAFQIVSAALAALVIILFLQNLGLKSDLGKMGVAKAQVQSTLDNERLKNAQAYAKQSEEFREKEKGYVKALDELDRTGKAELAKRDARIADLGRSRVRAESDLAAFVTAHRETTFAALPSGDRNAASAALDLLSDLYRSTNQRAGVLAAALDASYAAGKACEASYGAVKD